MRPRYSRPSYVRSLLDNEGREISRDVFPRVSRRSHGKTRVIGRVCGWNRRLLTYYTPKTQFRDRYCHGNKDDKSICTEQPETDLILWLTSWAMQGFDKCCYLVRNLSDRQVASRVSHVKHHVTCCLVDQASKQSSSRWRKKKKKKKKKDYIHRSS